MNRAECTFGDRVVLPWHARCIFRSFQEAQHQLFLSQIVSTAKLKSLPTISLSQNPRYPELLALSTGIVADLYGVAA